MKILADWRGKNALVKSAPLCLWNLRDELGGGGGGGLFSFARIPEVEGGNVSWKLLLGDDS